MYVCSYVADEEATEEECECEGPCNSKQFKKTLAWESCCHMIGDDSLIDENYDYVMSMASDKLEPEVKS